MHRLIFFLVFLIQNITGFAQTLTKPALDEIKNAPKWAQLLYADHPNYYEVEKGDTLYSISKKFNTIISIAFIIQLFQ